MVKVIAADGHEYDKSATANATVAPTNEATIANATNSKGLSSEELEFVTLVHYEYSLHGSLPTSNFLFEEYGFTAAEVKAYFTRANVTKALTERGVVLSAKQLDSVGVFEANELVTKKMAKLTPIQLVLANALLDLSDPKPDRKKIQDCGVTTRQYNMWLKDPDFQGYLRERAESMVGENHHEVLLGLIDKAKGGDTSAVKLYLEFTGRFVSQSASTNGGGQSVHDLQNIVIRIIEIILDEVDDPAVASRISDRLKGLVAGAQVAGLLPAPEVITVPEVAQARPITPEVEELTKRGLGYNS